MTRNPTRIGRYDLLTALATGSMGRVYLARATGVGGFERRFVIKTLEVPLAAERDPAIAMFLDEARLLGLLHHQHVASVFEVGVDDDGRHYMAIDYVDGCSADEVWARAAQLGAALPLDFTLTVASAVARGLHHAHTRKDLDGTPLGIVHRDVTPSNVMIGHDGAVQVIDFGIALARSRKSRTQTGFVKGKVGYLSPEQVAGREVDARTDVFALGVVLYELSTLHRAFRDDSDLATMQRIKAGRVTRPSLLVPGYPLELELIVMKALEVDPGQRFADAGALGRALEALGHRLHLVLGDAAIIEVMGQLFEPPAGSAARSAAVRAPEPSFDWTDPHHELTARRDPDELLAVPRAEDAAPARAGGSGRDDAPTTPDLPVRPRRLRAATERVDLLSIPTAGAPVAPLASPDTPSGITLPEGMAAAVAKRAVVRAAAPVITPSATPAITPSATPAITPSATPAAGELVTASPASGPARSRRRARLPWIGAIVLISLAPPAAYLVTRGASDMAGRMAAPPAPPGPPRERPPPPPPPPGPPAALAPPPVPARVRVRIVTHPADAIVWLDDRRLGRTPLDQVVAADPRRHAIKLRRKGYAIHRLDVTLDADIAEDVALRPQR